MQNRPRPAERLPDDLKRRNCIMLQCTKTDKANHKDIAHGKGIY